MNTIDKIVRRDWSDYEKDKLIGLGISNGVGGNGGFKFTEVAKRIIKSIIVYFPNLKVEKANKYLKDLDRLANECHDPDYFEGNNIIKRLFSDFRFARGVFILTYWTSMWVRILLFIVILIALWKNGGKYYNYGKLKNIKKIIYEYSKKKKNTYI